MKKNILIVDDDNRLRELLKDYLTEKKFEVYLCEDLNEAKEVLTFIIFDLIILDRMMPSGDGIDLVEFIKRKSNSPIIMLTAMGQDQNKIEGLKIGADDYLAKPFEPKELILRIKNILNKTNTLKDKREIEFGNIKINLNKMIIIKNNKQIKINNTEKKIFETLLNYPGKVFSRESIGKLIKIDKERSVDVIITRLRKKIEVDPKNPKFLQTMRGAGYVLWIK